MHTSRLSAVGGLPCGHEEVHPKAGACDDSSSSSNPSGIMATAAAAVLSPCSSHCIPGGPIDTASTDLSGLRQRPAEQSQQGGETRASVGAVHAAEEAAEAEGVTVAVAVDAGAAPAQLAALRPSAALHGTDASVLAQGRGPGEPPRGRAKGGPLTAATCRASIPQCSHRHCYAVHQTVY